MSVLTQVLEPLGVTAASDEAADVVVLHQVPPPEFIEQLRADGAVVCTTSLAVLEALGVTTTALPPHPSHDPLVADPVYTVEAGDLTFPLTGAIGIETEQVWATADGIPPKTSNEVVVRVVPSSLPNTGSWYAQTGVVLLILVGLAAVAISYPKLRRKLQIRR